MKLDAFARRKLEDAYIELAFRRAATDARWFFSDLVMIPSQRDSRGREPFELMAHQDSDLDTMLTEPYVIILKARQLGFSTLAMGLGLHEALFRPGANVLIFSKNQDAANKALGILKVMWQFLPDWMKARLPEVEAESTKHIVWRHEDGSVSTVKSFAATKTAGAGETGSYVILDEMALYEDPDQTYRTVLPTVDAAIASGRGRLLIVSTARGGYNRFATLYRGAKAGTNPFVPIFHPWWVSPFVGPDEYAAKEKDFRAEPWLFYAEYPSSEEEAFRESGRPRFVNLPNLGADSDFTYRGFLTREGEFVADLDGELRLTELEPDPTADYVLAVDPATGVGLDYTVGTIYGVGRDGIPDIVAVWRSNLTEQVEAARELARVGEWFTGHRGPALIVPEKVGGWADAMIVEWQQNLQYPRLYVHVLSGTRRNRAQQVIGFPMTPQRRHMVIDRLAEWVDADNPLRLTLYPELRSELGTFVIRDDGKVAADVGCHDDAVMSAAIGLFVCLDHAQPATPTPVGEAPRQTYDVSHIFEQAAEARRAEERAMRNQVRHWHAGRRQHVRRRTARW